MRVLIDGRGLLEELKAGVEGYTWQMIDYLQRMYPDDEYILFSYSWNKKPSNKQQEKVEWIHRRWPNLVMSFCWRWLEWPLVDWQADDIDVVWSPNIRFMPGSHRVKKIATVHDLSFEVMPSCFSYRRRLWHWHMNIKKNLLKMDRIVAVSENTKKDLMENYQIGGEKIKVIYSGVGRDQIDKNRSDYFKKKYNLNNYIITVGTVEPRKNLVGLIRAWSYYQQFCGGKEDLVIVGGQGWDHEIGSLVENMAWKNRVKFLGFISDEEKSILISQARLMVFGSFYEGFGFPPLEAMIREVPVLVSHAGSLGEIVGDGAMVIDPMDTVAMAVGIKSLVNSEPLRKKLINRGKIVAERYSWLNTTVAFRNELANLFVPVTENIGKVIS